MVWPFKWNLVSSTFTWYYLYLRFVLNFDFRHCKEWKGLFITEKKNIPGNHPHRKGKHFPERRSKNRKMHVILIQYFIVQLYNTQVKSIIEDPKIVFNEALITVWWWVSLDLLWTNLIHSSLFCLFFWWGWGGGGFMTVPCILYKGLPEIEGV